MCRNAVMLHNFTLRGPASWVHPGLYRITAGDGHKPEE